MRRDDQLIERSDRITALQLFRESALLGTTLIPNMTLQRGDNMLFAQGNFTVRINLISICNIYSLIAWQPNATPEGTETLDYFVGGTGEEN